MLPLDVILIRSTPYTPIPIPSYPVDLITNFSGCMFGNGKAAATAAIVNVFKKFLLLLIP
jgi:hypothetical protein